VSAAGGGAVRRYKSCSLCDRLARPTQSTCWAHEKPKPPRAEQKYSILSDVEKIDAAITVLVKRRDELTELITDMYAARARVSPPSATESQQQRPSDFARTL
jgi:hypothetical protein